MSKNSKIITYIIIILLFLTLGLFYSKPYVTSVLTDSGFDSSYSGSSGSSSSSFSSSGSHSSSSYGSSSSLGTGKSSPILDFIINIFSIIVLMYSLMFSAFFMLASLALIYIFAFKGKRINELPELSLLKSKRCNINRIRAVIEETNIEKFTFERINDIVKIQYYWMNFDYDKLKEYLTDELYNQYEMQLKTLSSKGQKNIMKDFVLYDYMITDAYQENGRNVLIMEIIISFIDYIDQKGVPIRGSSSKPIKIHYELIFTKSSGTTQDTCPNCGAKIEDTSSQVCPYCRSQIIQDSTKWVLSKKIAKGQR